MECFDEIRQGGGRVESFVSYCGGLPAPESSDNPLRYKFSWSPRGVLLNTLGIAKYLKEGEVPLFYQSFFLKANTAKFQVLRISKFQIVSIKEGDLMKTAHRLDFLPGFALEGFANRDSTIYQETYGINEAHTVLRGTLRYQGWREFPYDYQYM